MGLAKLNKNLFDVSVGTDAPDGILVRSADLLNTTFNDNLLAIISGDLVSVLFLCLTGKLWNDVELKGLNKNLWQQMKDVEHQSGKGAEDAVDGHQLVQRCV